MEIANVSLFEEFGNMIGLSVLESVAGKLFELGMQRHADDVAHAREWNRNVINRIFERIPPDFIHGTFTSTSWSANMFPTAFYDDMLLFLEEIDADSRNDFMMIGDGNSLVELYIEFVSSIISFCELLEDHAGPIPDNPQYSTFDYWTDLDSPLLSFEDARWAIALSYYELYDFAARKGLLSNA